MVLTLLTHRGFFKHKHYADAILTRYKASFVANAKNSRSWDWFQWDILFGGETSICSNGVERSIEQRIWNLSSPALRMLSCMDQSLKRFISISPPPPVQVLTKKKQFSLCFRNWIRLFMALKKTRACNVHFSHYLKGMSFFTSKFNASLFMYKKGMNFSYILLYST